MKTITVKKLRLSMQEVVKEVTTKATTFEVSLRSRPVFKIVPIKNVDSFEKAIKKITGTSTNKNTSSPAKDRLLLTSKLKKKYELQ